MVIVVNQKISQDAIRGLVAQIAIDIQLLFIEELVAR
jgi:hypothetical protein